MTETSRKIMRLTLVALLFQFIAPAFLFSTSCALVTSGSSTYNIGMHKHHSPIAISQFLKEKSETEIETDAFDADLVPLINFTVHSFALIQLHTNKFVLFPNKDRIGHHPPLFTLHHAFII